MTKHYASTGHSMDTDYRKNYKIDVRKKFKAIDAISHSG